MNKIIIKDQLFSYTTYKYMFLLNIKTQYRLKSNTGTTIDCANHCLGFHKKYSIDNFEYLLKLVETSNK